MIKATDLRIGNLVLDRGGKTLKISWFEPDKVCMEVFVMGQFVHPLTEYFDWLEPIPLTPEILVACGFDKQSNGTYAHVNSDLSCVFKISHVGDGKWYSINATTNIPILYLHQLQNLYYCLTGEEINYKP